MVRLPLAPSGCRLETRVPSALFFNRIGQLTGGEGRWPRMLRLLAFAAWFITMLVAGWVFSVAP